MLGDHVTPSLHTGCDSKHKDGYAINFLVNTETFYNTWSVADVYMTVYIGRLPGIVCTYLFAPITFIQSFFRVKKSIAVKLLMVFYC